MWARSWRTEVFEADVQHRQASESEIDASIEREPGYLVGLLRRTRRSCLRLSRWRSDLPIDGTASLSRSARICASLLSGAFGSISRLASRIPAALPFSTSETASRC